MILYFFFIFLNVKLKRCTPVGISRWDSAWGDACANTFYDPLWLHSAFIFFFLCLQFFWYSLQASYIRQFAFIYSRTSGVVLVSGIIWWQTAICMNVIHAHAPNIQNDGTLCLLSPANPIARINVDKWTFLWTRYFYFYFYLCPVRDVCSSEPSLFFPHSTGVQWWTQDVWGGRGERIKRAPVECGGAPSW